MPSDDNTKLKNIDGLRSALTKTVSDRGECDVILYNGDIGRPYDTELIRQCIMRKRRKNVFLILVTRGGDPDSAYKIARYFQDKYSRFTVYITGYCKSAGTLLALGAHELVISDHGELGPLDVQMAKKDDLLRKQSGLTVTTALRSLDAQSFQAFEQFFLRTQMGGGGLISVETASKIATDLVSGLYSSIYAQIDPLHVGEAGRASLIGLRYGEKLIKVAQNCAENTVEALATDFPSHGFVIDRAEAENLFVRVREPDEHEAALAILYENDVRLPQPDASDGSDLPFRFLTEEPHDIECFDGEPNAADDDGNEGASGPSPETKQGVDASGEAVEQQAAQADRDGA